MKIENLSTLKIHKLTQDQYDRELAAGNLDPTALYLTPGVGDNVDIDTTLTIAGMAADAKAVGDEISYVKSYILDIDYESTLAFDTSEIIFDTINTTSVLGQAILGQIILA